MTTKARSRRERPAKPALSREWIVAETIRIMRSEGLEKATMRRLAQALDTGPASIYVYVANSAELHMAVLEELLRSLEFRQDGTWRERIEALLDRYADVLYAHPGLARSALVLRHYGPNSVRLYEEILALLIEGGVAPARAAWGVDLLLQFMTASAAEHSEPSPSDIDAPIDHAAKWNNMTRALRLVTSEAAPNVAAHIDAVLGGTPQQRVRWAITALLAGIASTPSPLETATDSTLD